MATTAPEANPAADANPLATAPASAMNANDASTAPRAHQRQANRITEPTR